MAHSSGGHQTRMYPLRPQVGSMQLDQYGNRVPGVNINGRPAISARNVLTPLPSDPLMDSPEESARRNQAMQDALRMEAKARSSQVAAGGSPLASTPAQAGTSLADKRAAEEAELDRLGGIAGFKAPSPSYWNGPSTAEKLPPDSSEKVAVRLPGANAVDAAGPRPPAGTAAAAAWAAKIRGINEEIAAPHDLPAPEKPAAPSTKGLPATAADIAALNANDRAIAAEKAGATATPADAEAAAGSGKTIKTPYGDASSTSAGAKPGPTDYQQQQIALQKKILADHPALGDANSPESKAFVAAHKADPGADLAALAAKVDPPKAVAAATPAPAATVTGVPPVANPVSPVAAQPISPATVERDAGRNKIVRDEEGRPLPMALDAEGRMAPVERAANGKVTPNSEGGPASNKAPASSDVARDSEGRPVGPDNEGWTAPLRTWPPAAIPNGSTSSVPLPSVNLPQLIAPQVRPIGAPGMTHGPMTAETVLGNKPRVNPLNPMPPATPLPDQPVQRLAPVNRAADSVSATGGIPGAPSGQGSMVGKGESWDDYDARQKAAPSTVVPAAVSPQAALNPAADGGNSATAIPSGGLSTADKWGPTDRAALAAGATGNVETDANAHWALANAETAPAAAPVASSMPAPTHMPPNTGSVGQPSNWDAKGNQSAQNGGNDLSRPTTSLTNSGPQGNQSPLNGGNEIPPNPATAIGSMRPTLSSGDITAPVPDDPDELLRKQAAGQSYRSPSSVAQGYA